MWRKNKGKTKNGLTKKERGSNLKGRHYRKSRIHTGKIRMPKFVPSEYSD